MPLSYFLEGLQCWLSRFFYPFDGSTVSFECGIMLREPENQTVFKLEPVCTVVVRIKCEFCV